MNKNPVINGLINLLIIQVIIFSVSNLLVVTVNTYESIFGKLELNPVSFINLRVLVIPIWGLAAIICIYRSLCRARKINLQIKKIDIRLFFLVGILFLLSAVIVFLGDIYVEGLVYIDDNLIEINRHTLVLLLVFLISIAILIYTLIKIIRKRALLISKVGSRLIRIIGIAFAGSMLLLNTMSKFIESYLLDYINLKPKKFVEIYNTVSLGFIIVVLVAFILIILSAVNKWVEYLNYMTIKLSRISEIQYIDYLDINGNDEFSELANGINIMSKRLKDNYEKEKQIEKAKNDLIVSVSHDLKTPLTSIIGYLELLKYEKIENDEKRSECVDIVYEKSISLKKLIEELFEYTKISNDYISLKKVKFNIAILVNQIIGEQTLFFKEKNINIEFKSESNEIYCEIDIEKMVRVIENIVKNAQKYSFQNTNFKVYIEEYEEEVLISFENISEHINKEELNLIFEKMYRRDKSRSSENEGSGLGLAIAKKLVELHNGKLWAECEGNTIKINMLLPKK